MAQLIDIKKVSINPRTLVATIRISDDAPLYTGDDPEATDLIADLIPELADHACYGDGAATFGEVMGDTELAHLLEHVTVELLACTNLAGAISGGQTREIDKYERTYELRFACPDDVLVAGALSSASWIIDWAFNGGGAPEPDIDAIAKGLVALVDGLDAETDAAEPVDEPVADADATIITAPILDDLDEPEAEEPAAVEEPVDEPEAEQAAQPEVEDPQVDDDVTDPRADE